MREVVQTRPVDIKGASQRFLVVNKEHRAASSVQPRKLVTRDNIEVLVSATTNAKKGMNAKNLKLPKGFMKNFPRSQFSPAVRSTIALQYRVDLAQLLLQDATVRAAQPLNPDRHEDAGKRQNELSVLHTTLNDAYRKRLARHDPSSNLQYPPEIPEPDGQQEAKVYDLEEHRQRIHLKRDVRRAKELAWSNLLYYNADVWPRTDEEDVSPFFGEPLSQIIDGLTAFTNRNEEVPLSEARGALQRTINQLYFASGGAPDPERVVYSALYNQWTHVRILQKVGEISTLAGALAYYSTLAQRFSNGPNNPNNSA